MDYKPTLLRALAYIIVTFPLAVIWHGVLFEEKYKAFGYFEGDSSFALGLATIIIQGCVLSFFYPFVAFSAFLSASFFKKSLCQSSQEAA